MKTYHLSFWIFTDLFLFSLVKQTQVFPWASGKSEMFVTSLASSRFDNCNVRYSMKLHVNSTSDNCNQFFSSLATSPQNYDPVMSMLRAIPLAADYLADRVQTMHTRYLQLTRLSYFSVDHRLKEWPAIGVSTAYPRWQDLFVFRWPSFVLLAHARSWIRIFTDIRVATRLPALLQTG